MEESAPGESCVEEHPEIADGPVHRGPRSYRELQLARDCRSAFSLVKSSRPILGKPVRPSPSEAQLEDPFIFLKITAKPSLQSTEDPRKRRCTDKDPVLEKMMGIKWPWEREKITEIWDWPIIFWLNIYGWWAEEASRPVLRRWLWWLRFFLLINVFFNFWAMIIAVFIKFSQGDIMANLFSVFAAGPGVVGTFKIVQCIRHRAILKEGMDLLDKMLGEVTEPELEPLVRRRLKRSWLGFSLFLIFGTCITLHWLTRPLLLAIFYQQKTRILDTWPVFVDTWTQWFFSYLFQGSNVCLCGHTFYIFDNIYFCMSENLLCHLEILKYRLTHLRLDGSNKSDAVLDKCIKHHCQILRVCDRLKEASEGVIFFQCINTVIMLCTGIFILLLMDGINMNVVMNLGEITSVIVCILFAYCWYSNEITYQCANLYRSGYMVDWVEGPIEQKRKLHNFMTMSMQPVIFGGIVEIDLNTFINVLKTTFSYYNFLVAAKESNDH